MCHQQLDSGGHGVLLSLRAFLPPCSELVRVLNRPRHGRSIFRMRNHVQLATGRSGDNGLRRTRAQAPQSVRGSQAVGGVFPAYRRLHVAASRRLGDSIAEVGVIEPAGHLGASSLGPVLRSRPRGSRNCGLGVVTKPRKDTHHARLPELVISRRPIATRLSVPLCDLRVVTGGAVVCGLCPTFADGRAIGTCRYAALRSQALVCFPSVGATPCPLLFEPQHSAT